MKLATASLLLALFSSAHAFAPSVVSTRRSSGTALCVRPDTAEAVKAAMEATKKYGATSPEARLAWDAVEEMDSSDNSAATAGSLDSECLIEDEISESCKDYGEKLDDLFTLIQENQPKIDRMKDLAANLKDIKLTVEEKQAKASVQASEAMNIAIKEAKKTEEEFGKGSKEAIVAWSEVEEVASSGLENAMGSRLDEECVVDSANEACKALDELNQALEKMNAE